MRNLVILGISLVLGYYLSKKISEPVKENIIKKDTKSEQVMSSVKIILEHGSRKPRIGIILGSGMGDVTNFIKNAIYIPYEDLPGFSKSTVHGHAGNVVIGTLNGIEVVCLQGRVHYYEGGNANAVMVPINTLKMLGCEVLLATAAVGSLNEDIGPGSVVVVKDHINFQGVNPLVGPNDDIFGCRFPSLQNAYDKELRDLIHEAGQKADTREMTEGVYCSCLGPSFETPAEVKMIKSFGADIVGMSLVGEIIAARHCGLKCSALAIVVNLAEGMSDTKITHEETLHYTAEVAESVATLTMEYVKLVDESLTKKYKTLNNLGGRGGGQEEWYGPDLKPEQDQKSDPEQESDQEPVQELEPIQNIKSEQESEPEQESELEQESGPEQESESELESEQKPETDLDQEPELDQEQESKLDLDKEPNQEPGQEPKPEQESESELDKEPEPDQEPIQEQESEPELEPEQEPELDQESELEPIQEKESEPELDLDQES